MSDLIWSPIGRILQEHSNISKLYYAKSGLLHRINMAAIPSKDGGVLSKQFRLVAMSSTRELIKPIRSSTTTQQSAALSEDRQRCERMHQKDQFLGVATPVAL